MAAFLVSEAILFLLASAFNIYSYEKKPSIHNAVGIVLFGVFGIMSLIFGLILFYRDGVWL